MRQFVILGHDVPTTPDFSLDNLPSGAGRLDVLCRCVNAAFFLSHGLRSDVRVHLVVADTYTITFDGGSLKHLHPDERTIASRIRNALDRADEAIGHMPAEVSPGVSLYRFGFSELLNRIADSGTIVELHEDGTPIVEIESPSNPIFVLSDHHDFTDEEADALADVAALRVRVSPKLLHADHTITVVHNALDTNGFRTYE